MTTALPARVSLSRNEDLRLAFEIVDENGSAVARPSGTWTFVLKSRSVEVPITLTERSTNIWDAIALVASIDSVMPVGRLFVGDLKRVSGGATEVWASVAVVREDVVQETEDLGLRVLRVTRTDGETVRLEVSSAALFDLVEDAADAAATAAATAAAAAAVVAIEDQEADSIAAVQSQQTTSVNAVVAQGTATLAAVTASVSATSTSSVTIGTGSLSFTIETGKPFVLGQRLRATATTDFWVEGTVTAHNPTTGALTLNSTLTSGSGSFASWTFSIIGQPGVAGGFTIGTTSISGGTNNRFLRVASGAVGEVPVMTWDGTTLTINAPIRGGHGGTGISTNVSIGPTAGNALTGSTTGTRNVCIGDAAGRLLSNTSSAVAIGYAALWSATTGAANTIAIGQFAMQYGLGTNNVAIGNSAMVGAASGTFTGYANIALGVSSGAQITTGFQNICIGQNAGSRIGTGSQNVCLGTNAGNGNANLVEVTAIGNGVLQSATADYNTGVGAHALQYTTSGSALVGLGANAGQNNLTGSRLTAIGYDCLKNQTAADDNTGVGYFALLNATGGRNTAIGSGALQNVTSGVDNIGVGMGAGASLTTGSGNLILGPQTVSATLANHVLIANGAGTLRVTIDGNGDTAFAGRTVRTATGTVAGLPSASSVGAGARGWATDATQTFSSANFGAVVTGGGANGVPVVSDGTNWRIG